MVTRIETESEMITEPKQPSLIDLNRAGEAALRSLPGIDRGLALRIIAYRDEHGPFLFEEDITQVDGIGPNLYEELADRLTVTIPTSEELANETEPSLAETYGGFADNAAAAGVAEPQPIPEEVPVDEAEVHPLAVVAPLPMLHAEKTTTGDEAGLELDTDSAEEPVEPESPPEEHAAIPMPGPVAEEPISPKSEPAAKQRGRFTWFWTAMLGAALGGLLGLGLSMLVFAGINGSVDVNRSVAIQQVNGQLNELSVELDAVQGDVGILQGDVSGLRERVEVLSGLTARVEQAEETLATFTKEIQALKDETQALTSSMTELSRDVDTMGETLDAVEAQTEKATTFFERLQQLLQEIFVEQLTEPQSAAPQTAAPDLEVAA